MKLLLLLLLLIPFPYLYKIQYVGTKTVAYSNTEPYYEERTDIIIFKLINGKYIKINNSKIKQK